MFVIELKTDNNRLRLIRPNVHRDAPLSMEWLAHSSGRETLRLMGVADKENEASTLEKEVVRIKKFLAGKDEVYWMIESEGVIIGAIWVGLKPTKHLAAPSVHIMIGDPKARGRGIGVSALRSVLLWLETEREIPVVYSRHLVDNVASAKLLKKVRFQNDGVFYEDKDGLQWQNMKRVILKT